MVPCHGTPEQIFCRLGAILKNQEPHWKFKNDSKYATFGTVLHHAV
jgi:hypothetical protein